jgi:glycosyltransferase involved in cell wall biosynthesis
MKSINVKKNILFLCAQPAGYLLDCIDAIDRDKYDITCIFLDEDTLAPFDLSKYKDINFNRISKNIRLDKLLSLILFQPHLIFVAGWAIKAYIKLIKLYNKSNISIVLMIDTPWLNSKKQKIFSIYFRYFIKSLFSFIWVPGESQVEYSIKLGFKRDEIFTGLYTTQHKLFGNNLNLERFHSSSKKTLLYAGRLVSYKGVKTLVNVWNTLTIDERNGWKVLIVGNGPEAMYCINSGLNVVPFVQPNELSQIMQQSHAYYLGSIIENWGVSVHDASAAGLPLILSSGVISGRTFLKDSENGFLFKPNDETDLRKKMLKLFNLSNEDLVKMSNYSITVSNTHSVENWLKTIEYFAFTMK